jgi:threonine dehydratase
MPSSTVSGQALPTWHDVASAAERIAPMVTHTPILSSSLLNRWLGHELYFKAECLQKVGAFKARGACNAIAELCERGAPPRCIVANSSGNHAQAIAWAARRFDVPARIYMPANVSPIKLAATREYGAETVLWPTRAEVDTEVAVAAREPGVEWIHPFNRVEVIAGQGTAAWEALQTLGRVDAVCAPCGGGGLLSGTLLAARHLCPTAQVIGAEPLLANDAARSRREGRIVRLEQTPDTMADGARTLWVGDLTFDFIRQADAFYEITETEIAYWTQWLNHLLKLHLEPTSALAMAGALRWLSTAEQPKKVLVVLSGGNVASDMMRTLYSEDHLNQHPTLKH